MSQRRIPAAFIRGGTSKGLFFRAADLPADPTARNTLFLAAIGSPDPNGRQLDGMGGGISSLSKVVVVAPPSRDDADVDYTFGQVAVDAALVDYDSNCGNLTSAVGPFAVDEKLVPAADGEAVLTLHNTNTGKLIRSRFAVRDGLAVTEGDTALPGVAGTAAPIRLGFDQPGGAVTGRLLPTGNVVDELDVPDVGRVRTSLIDATTAMAFVAAADVGLTGTELPDALEADADLMQRLGAIRQAAAAAMDIPPETQSVPKLGLIAGPAAAETLAGDTVAPDAMHLTARMLSMGRIHRALPLTGALCLAVAARITGSVVADLARPTETDLAIAHPSGLIEVKASVRQDPDWQADSVEVIRTQRRLMEGVVLVPEGIDPG